MDWWWNDSIQQNDYSLHDKEATEEKHYASINEATEVCSKCGKPDVGCPCWWCGY